MTIRRKIVLCGMLAAAATAIFEGATFSQHVAPSEASNADSRLREPIPTDAAPKEFKRLIEGGKVAVVYDSDPEFVKSARG